MTQPQPKKASIWLAEQIAGAGISHVFFLEAILRDTLNELRRKGVCTILPHTEKAAAYMADGYARVAGKPGLCWAQSVGAANLAAGLQDAWLARTPLIALTGRKPEQDQDRNAYQEIDHAKAFAAVTRYGGKVARAADLPRLLAHAWRSCLADAPRPVHLDLPGLMAEFLESDEVDERHAPPDLLKNIGREARPPAAHQIEAAAAALRCAQRLVIVAGGDAVACGAGPAVLALAEQLGAPVATTVGARTLLPSAHVLAIGTIGSYGMPATNRIVHQADAVLVIGARLSDQNTHAWRVPGLHQAIVQIDADATEVGRAYPHALPVVGALDAAVEVLAERLAGHRSDAGFAREAAASVQAWRHDTAALRADDGSPVRVERLCAEVSAALPDDGILVADTGYSAIWTCTHVDIRAGQTYLRAAGSLGWAFPAALGAQCAAPTRRVLCFCGDGAFYYHMAEIETALRHGLPVTVVVNNNSAFGQDACNMVARGMPLDDVRALSRFRATDFAAIARAFGANGVRVTAPGQLPQALADAMRADRLTVVDVVTDWMCRAPDPWAPPS